MKVRTAFLLVLTLLVAACERRAADDEAAADPAATGDVEYALTPLEYPGATATGASGISDAGEVVGWYVQDGAMKGFVYRGGEFTTVEFPGAARTQINGIGADGSLVGAYRREGEPPVAFHPFMRTPAGEFVEIKHPDYAYGMMQRILPDGTLVGCFHRDSLPTTMYAATVRDGRTALHEAAGTMYTGITPDGHRLVGLGESGGFVVDGERQTPVHVPGSARTEVWDINRGGTLVGLQVDSADVTRGFVHADGRWTTIALPDARGTVTFGINASGRIVGTYQDTAGVRRGYIGEPRTR